MSNEYTPTGSDLAIARSELAAHLIKYRDSGEARAVAADAFTLGAARRELEDAASVPAERIRYALAALLAREEWYDKT